MSFTYTTVLMLGIRATKEELNINSIYDDQWLPYVEGHEDTDIRMLRSESNDYIYIGKVLASWNKYEDYNIYKEFEAWDFDMRRDIAQITNFIKKEFNFYCNMPKLMFFVEVS